MVYALSKGHSGQFVIMSYFFSLTRQAVIDLALRAVLAHASAKRGQKRLPVRVIAENRLAAVAAIQHRLPRPGIFHPQFAHHPQTLSHPQSYVISRTDPFRLYALSKGHSGLTLYGS